MNRVKIILLGKMGVGKTCFAMSYIYGKFYANGESTVGVGFFSKKVDNVKLEIWDTAGSERFGSFTKIYSRGAKYALVCFEDPITEDIQQYINLLDEQTEIILIVTKVEDRKIVYKDIENKFPFKIFYTSSYYGTGIESVFDYIISKERSVIGVEDNTIVNLNERKCCLLI